MLAVIVGNWTPMPGLLTLNPQATIVIQSGGQLALSNGQRLGPGTYTGANINALLSLIPVDTPAAAQITLTTDTSTLLLGQSAAMVTASVGLTDGTVLAGGTLHFYTSRPSYDRNRFTGETRPCLDEAEKTRISLGDVTVVNGQAQLSVANLPVGENWVWAEYESADGLSKATSALATLTVRVPVGLHVEQGSIATLTNLPDIAVTLIDGSGNPLGNVGFASPSVYGTMQQSTASVAFKIPLPPPLPVASTVLGGIGAFEAVSVAGTVTLSGSFSCTGTTGWSGAGMLAFSAFYSATLGNYASQWDHVAYHVPTPAGTVTFREGDQILGTTSISGSGIAFFRPQGLSLGHHTITVSYDGDNSFVAAGTQTVEFDVTRTPVTVTLATSQAQVLQGRDFS